jgi:hypothetical protein
MTDADEQSIPSRGSHGEPDAWFAAGQDGRLLWGERRREMVARYVVDGTPIVPLYRQPQPTLTDEEREALQWAEDASNTKRAAAIRGLLKRLG